MRWESDRESRGGVAINSPTGRHRRQPPRPRSRAGMVAIGIIAAAIVATFLALLITSRPYDPMDSTVDPQREVPASAISHSSPKPSPSVTTGLTSATPLPAETAGDAASPDVPDDTAIQSEIERRFSSDAMLAGLDVSTIVEGGKVTVVGSVRSAELKSRVERTVRAIKDVLAVDNQLVVIEPTP